MIGNNTPSISVLAIIILGLGVVPAANACGEHNQETMQQIQQRAGSVEYAIQGQVQIQKQIVLTTPQRQIQQTRTEIQPDSEGWFKITRWATPNEGKNRVQFPYQFNVSEFPMQLQLQLLQSQVWVPGFDWVDVGMLTNLGEGYSSLLYPGQKVRVRIYKHS